MARYSGRRSGLARLAERAIAGWALLGGIIILIMVAVNVLEVATGFTRPFTGYRFTGGVEITEMFVAVAAFCFLPWCQLTDANVTADIFTARAGPRTIAVFKLAAAIVALGFSLLLFWRMTLGMVDQREFGYATTILNIPIWLAFIPILVSLALLAVAALITLGEEGRKAVGAGGER